MPIHLALEIAYRLSERGLRAQDLRHGSDQILGAHLVDALRREQADLRSLFQLHRTAQFSGDPSADALQVGFGQSFLTR